MRRAAAPLRSRSSRPRTFRVPAAPTINDERGTTDSAHRGRLPVGPGRTVAQLPACLPQLARRGTRRGRGRQPRARCLRVAAATQERPPAGAHGHHRYPLAWPAPLGDCAAGADEHPGAGGLQRDVGAGVGAHGERGRHDGREGQGHAAGGRARFLRRRAGRRRAAAGRRRRPGGAGGRPHAGGGAGPADADGQEGDGSGKTSTSNWGGTRSPSRRVPAREAGSRRRERSGNPASLARRRTGSRSLQRCAAVWCAQGP